MAAYSGSLVPVANDALNAYDAMFRSFFSFVSSKEFWGLLAIFFVIMVFIRLVFPPMTDEEIAAMDEAERLEEERLEKEEFEAFAALSPLEREFQNKKLQEAILERTQEAVEKAESAKSSASTAATVGFLGWFF